MSLLDPTANFAKVALSTGYDAAATSVVLSSGLGAILPQPSTDGAFNIVWYNATDYGDPTDDPNREIVRCTARTTDTLTITRAQEGTSAATHNTAGKTYKFILAVTQKMINDIQTAIVNASLGVVPVGGQLNFLKSLTNTPALPAQFVELNGQTISDAASVYNGVVMPTLNSTNKFLRGNTTSGGTGGNTTTTLSVGYTPNISVCSDLAASGSTSPCFITSVAGNTTTITMPTFNNAPSFYDVVRILRIK